MSVLGGLNKRRGNDSLDPVIKEILDKRKIDVPRYACKDYRIQKGQSLKSEDCRDKAGQEDR